MLIRLFPEQVSNHWDVVKPAIKNSLHFACESVDMNEVLTSLLNGSMQCWVSSRKSNGSNVLEGVVTTMISKDLFGEDKSLLIYSLFGYDMANREAWKGALKALITFAKASGCNRIIAYTNVSSLIKLVEGLGGSADQRFVSIPVDALLEIPA